MYIGDGSLCTIAKIRFALLIVLIQCKIQVVSNNTPMQKMCLGIDVA